jgi:hypothetical protein
MEDDDLAVGGEPEVALDSGAHLEGSGESDDAVLGKARAIVQPAMREPRGPGIERIRL